MNINETVTDLDYIKTEILKISIEYGIQFEILMDEFTDMLLTTVLDSRDVLCEIRRMSDALIDKKTPKTV